MGNSGFIVFLISLILGLYFLNVTFAFYALPESLEGLNKWISAIGGILIILGGINYWRLERHRNMVYPR